MAAVKEALAQFCASTSLRGAAKLVKAPTRALRVLWAVYICAMAAALAACICFIAKDYLQYKTIIQTNVVLNDDSIAIPAVTICSHYPFSDTARDLWRSGRVQSPSNFSRGLRRSAYRLFNASQFLAAESLLASDTKSVYYQSISHADALNVSFSVKQMFVFCITGVGAFMEISDWQDCSLLLKRVSLPTYFNCYQVQAARDIDWLTLVLRVSSGVPNAYEEAFVQDIFEQADGIRLQVHENNTYPEPTLKGIHVEPGKLIEISYKSVRWVEVDSPSDACMPADAANQWRIRDLDQQFAYSYEACLGQELGRLALRSCGCHYASHLRDGLPNDTHRYCGDVRAGVDRVLRNARCLRSLDLEAQRKRLSNSVCLMPCHFHYFDTVASKTVWRTTEWQLHWLMKHSRCFRDIDEASEQLAQPSSLSPGERRALKERLRGAVHAMRLFFEADNITQIASLDGDDEEPHGAVQSKQPTVPTVDSNFAYLTLRRQSRNTVRKTETLSLGLSALMSQVGGLCSLFLGLTCAFFVELLELGLLGRHRMKQRQQKKRRHSGGKGAGLDDPEEDADGNVAMEAAAAK